MVERILPEGHSQALSERSLTIFILTLYHDPGKCQLHIINHNEIK
jgi:hypothetical protein